MLQYVSGTCWLSLNSSCSPCFVNKQKRRINLCLSLTLSLTWTPQRGLVCTPFSCSVASTMNQGTKAEYSETAWHALTIQSLGKESLYWMSFGPPFSHPLSPATSFSTVFLGPDRGFYGPSTSLWENELNFTLLLKVTFLNMSNSLNWHPCLRQQQEAIEGQDKSSIFNCIKEVSKAFWGFCFHPTCTDTDTHRHIIGSYLSVLQMEVLWTAACTEMKTAHTSSWH